MNNPYLIVKNTLGKMMLSMYSVEGEEAGIKSDSELALVFSNQYSVVSLDSSGSWVSFD